MNSSADNHFFTLFISEQKEKYVRNFRTCTGVSPASKKSMENIALSWLTLFSTSYNFLIKHHVLIFHKDEFAFKKINNTNNYAPFKCYPFIICVVHVI